MKAKTHQNSPVRTNGNPELISLADEHSNFE